MNPFKKIKAILRDARDADRLRVQLVGVSIAALGGTDPGQVATPGQFGWSVAYDDVLKLRRRCDRAEFLIRRAAKDVHKLIQPSSFEIACTEYCDDYGIGELS